MNEQMILQQLSIMPENLKQEVLDFMGYLLMKHKMTGVSPKTPKFGSAKGKYILASDFDEPLEDFNEYMS